MRYDFGAFAGHWPFRYLRLGELGRQLEVLKELGIEGGIVSSLEAVFYNDPWEGDERLLARLPEGWKLAMCVNPRLPWSETAMDAAREKGVAALRLYPGIHGYGAAEAAGICAQAERLGMAVLVTARLEDDRLSYLLKQEAVAAEDWCALAEKHPCVPFVLSGFYLHELEGLKLPGNVWADTAGLCHGLDPAGQLLAAGFPGERLLFGSFSPLQCAVSHLLNLPAAERERILTENPRRFWEEYND